MALASIVWKPATIAVGASLSDAVPMVGRRLVAIRQAASCEGTAFGLQASHDGGTTYTNVYNTIQESTGAAPVTALWEVAKSATIAQYINLPDAFRVVGPTHIKIRSEDGSNSGTNQADTDQTVWLGFEELQAPGG